MASEVTFYAASTDDALTSDYFNWGNQKRGASIDREFRVRNDSTLYTAEEVLVRTTGAAAAWIYFSLDDGTTFTGVATVGDLIPLEFSQPIIARLITPSAAPLALAQYSTQAYVTRWS